MARDLVYAHLASWEYGCCGTVPAVGAPLEGHLFGRPATVADQFTVTADRWDPERELVFVGSTVAGWATGDGDPTAAHIRLVLTWHDTQPTLSPRIAAEIVELYEVSVQRELRDGAWRPIAGTKQYRSVQTTPQHGPNDLGFDEVSGHGFDGVVVGMKITSEELPTEEDRMQLAEDRERGSRRVTLRGPATLFGDTVPALGDRMTLDVADPRFTEATGSGLERLPRLGPVSGSVQQQVSTFHPFADGSGGGEFRAAEAGTPTKEVAEELFLVLEIDPEEFG